jgi:hypothetical protein
MQMSGQLHVLAALPLKKSPIPCPLSRRLVGPTDCLERGKNHSCNDSIKSRHTVLQKSTYVLAQEKCPIFSGGKCIKRMAEVNEMILFLMLA